jgi:molecular chaperone DnaK
MRDARCARELTLASRISHQELRMGIEIGIGTAAKEKPLAVGIDLGTTNSLVAYVKDSVPVVIKGPDGKSLVPSIVSFQPDNMFVGAAARNYRLIDAQHTVFSVKRLMGRGIEDIRDELEFFPYEVVGHGQEMVKIKINQREYTPPEISSMILKELKFIAEKELKRPVVQAVITVPAYFNDAQRQATKDAGKIAGLEVLRILNEPTAAALAYGLDKIKEGTIAVYDFGGGTFDISILKVKDGIFQVLATNGNTHLGGDDIDNRLSQFLTDMIRKFGWKGEIDSNLQQQIRDAAERAKWDLSDAHETKIVILLNGQNFELALSRTDFEALVGDIVERTIKPCTMALADAGVQPGQIDEVVLVGGSTRMPLVRKRVQELFGKVPKSDLNPDEVVALGAAVQADILAGTSTHDMLLLDITPLSLGIETYGGAMTKLIERNSTIPNSATEYFTTFVDNQTGIDVHVLQGDRELAKDNRSLAKFQLKGIDPMPAGLPRIEVTFMIDANGILNVTARDMRTGKQQSLEVKPSYGLTDEEVERMLIDSMESAETDFEARMLIDARNDADIVLRSTEKALKRADEFISAKEQEQIRQAEKELRDAYAGKNHTLIREKIEKLDQSTQTLAQGIMNSTITNALKDKTLDQLEEEAEKTTHK